MPEDRETSDDRHERPQPPGAEFRYMGQQIHHHEKADHWVTRAIESRAFSDVTYHRALRLVDAGCAQRSVKH